MWESCDEATVCSVTAPYTFQDPSIYSIERPHKSYDVAEDGRGAPGAAFLLPYPLVNHLQLVESKSTAVRWKVGAWTLESWPMGWKDWRTIVVLKLHNCIACSYRAQALAGWSSVAVMEGDVATRKGKALAYHNMTCIGQLAQSTGRAFRKGATCLRAEAR